MEGVPLLEKSPHTNGTRRKHRAKHSNYAYERDADDGRVYDIEALEPYEIEESVPGHLERRPVKSAARYLMICAGVLFFLLLMYIPAYRQADRQFGVIQGWSANTSRDTRTYVLPDNITILNQPLKLCGDETGDDKLFLLIVVCSATENFEARHAIRDTWASYSKYQMLNNLFANITKWSKDLKVTDAMIRDAESNFSVVLRRRKRYTNGANIANVNLLDIVRKKRRVISGLSDLVSGLNEALADNPYFLNNKHVQGTEDDSSFVTEGNDPRFDFGSENGGIEKTVLGNKLEAEYDDTESTEYSDYGMEKSNIMKIPPRGYEDDINIDRILKNLKKKQASEMKKQKGKKNAADEHKDLEGITTTPKIPFPDFKVVFLLGMPQNDNTSEIQNKIDQELLEFGDIIQEGFIDTYNNLTLKSVMLLKWVNSQCNNAQYIMKTDDDMFVNVPNLVRDLKNKSFLCASNRVKQIVNKKVEEHGHDPLLMGVVFCGARPILDPSNKWYSPRYMYDGRVYPCYLSGTGYVMTATTAKYLYTAALDTPLFHLEDVYITGMCAEIAGIKPITHMGFSHLKRADNVCELFSSITAHGAVPYSMRSGMAMLTNRTAVQQCEIRRLVSESLMREKAKKTGRRYKYVRKTCI